jgi:hypothetical protein
MRDIPFRSPAMNGISILPIERLALAFAPRPWPFASERRADIDRYFGELQRRHPGTWNGHTLLLHEHSIDDAEFRGTYFETDFASFIAWRDWDFPDPSVRNCFAMGAIRASDGAYLLGVMAPHTVNAGKIYFPAGTLDRNDIIGTTIDLAGNIRREVAEETGLGPGDYQAEDGWNCVLAGARIALMKILQARDTADVLRARILTHLARERQPELTDIRIVRGSADLHPMMPPFVTAFLTTAWSRYGP